MILCLLFLVGLSATVSSSGKEKQMTCIRLKKSVDTSLFSRKTSQPVSTLSIRATFPRILSVHWNTTNSVFFKVSNSSRNNFIKVTGRVLSNNKNWKAVYLDSPVVALKSFSRQKLTLLGHNSDLLLSQLTVVLDIKISVNSIIRTFSRRLNYTKILRSAPSRFYYKTNLNRRKLTFIWSSRVTRKWKDGKKPLADNALPSVAVVFRVSPKQATIKRTRGNSTQVTFHLKKPLIRSSLHRLRLDVKPSRKIKIISSCLFQVNSRGVISAPEPTSPYDDPQYYLPYQQVTTTTTQKIVSKRPISCKIVGETGGCQRSKLAAPPSNAQLIRDPWPWCAGPGSCPGNRNESQRIVLVRKAAFRGNDFAAVKLAWFRIPGSKPARSLSLRSNKGLGGDVKSFFSSGILQSENSLSILLSIRFPPEKYSQLLLALMAFQPVRARSLERRVVRDLLLVTIQGNELVFFYQSLCSNGQFQTARLLTGQAQDKKRKRKRKRRGNNRSSKTKSVILKIDIAQDALWFRTVNRARSVNVVSIMPNRVASNESYSFSRSDVPPPDYSRVDCSAAGKPLSSVFTHLYIGGLPANLYHVLSLQDFSHNFTGCVRQLSVNGREMVWRPIRYGGYVSEATAIADCHAQACSKRPCSGTKTVCAPFSNRRRTCLCSTLSSRATAVGNSSDQTCSADYSESSNKWLQKATLLNFNSLSHLEMTWSGLFVQEEFIIRMNFKPNSVKSGLLLFAKGDSPTSDDYFLIHLENGCIVLQMDQGGGPVLIRTRHSASVKDWNALEVAKNKSFVAVKLNTARPIVSMLVHPTNANRSRPSIINVRDPVYIGGVPLFSPLARNDKLKGYSGCIDQLQLNAYRLQWVPHAVRLFGVTTCSHTCDSNPCQNGATCVPQGDFYVCFCQRGFSGFECQNALLDTQISPLP